MRNTSIKGNIRVRVENGNYVLSGSVADERSYIVASRVGAEIVGLGRIVNETRINLEFASTRASEQIGIIDIFVNNRYDDSPDNLRQLAAVLKLPQFEIGNVEPNDTISNIILRRYGFGPSDLPLSYHLVENAILALNGLSRATDLKPGTIRLSILPRRAAPPVVAPAPVVNQHQGFILYGVGIVSANLSLGISANAVEVIAKLPATAPEPFVLQVPVTSGNLRETKDAASGLPSNVSSKKIYIRLASGDEVGSVIHDTMKAADKAAVVSALSKKRLRHSTVFILDSGWPDATNYANSVRFIQRMLNVATKLYNLPAVQWTMPPFVAPASESSSSHCARIRDSLQEFTKLDKVGAVDVVYVPLTKAQNSSFLLRELLRMYYIRNWSATKTQVPDVVLKGADDFATTSLETNIASDMKGTDISSDAAVLQALWSLADLSSQDGPKSVFFINESWTIKPGTAEDMHSGVSAGIAVAAVGNTPGKVVNSDIGGIDFARQCATTKSVLAVLDVKPAVGIFCDSSIVKQTVIDDTLAASYDGEVFEKSDTAAGLCGSSFSAPRVAWLLALNEAVRAQYVERTDWPIYLTHKILKLRTPSTDPWVSLYISPSELLK